MELKAVFDIVHVLIDVFLQINAVGRFDQEVTIRQVILHNSTSTRTNTVLDVLAWKHKNQ